MLHVKASSSLLLCIKRRSWLWCWRWPDQIDLKRCDASPEVVDDMVVVPSLSSVFICKIPSNLYYFASNLHNAAHICLLEHSWDLKPLALFGLLPCLFSLPSLTLHLSLSEDISYQPGEHKCMNQRSASHPTQIPEYILYYIIRMFWFTLAPHRHESTQLISETVY